MTRPELIIIGAGGHAYACIDVIEHEGRFNIAGLVGVSQEVGSTHLGYEVLDTDEALPALAKKFEYAMIGIGQIKSPVQRTELFHRALDCGFKFPAIISPAARVSGHATVGSGTIVMHGAVVNAGAIVGNNCIVNTGSIVEHDVVLGNYCHVSTAAVINGDSRVGEGSFLGSGSIIKEGLTLGADCLVGMGACVRYDLDRGARFTGTKDS